MGLPSKSNPCFKGIKSFTDVQVDESTEIETTAFLEASDGLVSMFDLFDSRVFTFVQADLRKNIRGVRERYSQSPSTSLTLESLGRHDIAQGQRHATECLLLLLRGLSLTHTALQDSRDNEREEISTSFKRAYDTTLRHHHNSIVRTVVVVAIKACPRRHEFHSRLAQGDSPEELHEELGKWLIALGGVLCHMKKFYET